MVVFVRAFRHVARRLGVPRAVITPHLMGRTVGPAGDIHRQTEVVKAAIELLETATAPETLVEL